MNVALEHCERRPSPAPPVNDLWIGTSCVGVGGTQSTALVQFFFAAACAELVKEAQDQGAKDNG